MASTSNETDEKDHSHCQTCVTKHCRSSDECPQIQCPNICGAVFHACKKDEHLLLCKKEICECLNANNGCPLKMTRAKLNKHLEVCPASVIHCSMEWNRWPVYSKERKARVPFNQDNLHARYGQLDVALALRDQRMLNAALKAPRKFRRSLRNNLTQRFPAVPFMPPKSEPEYLSSDTTEDPSATASDDESDAPWTTSKNPPGLLRSVYKGLFGIKSKSKENSPVPDIKDNNEHHFVNENISVDLNNIQCSNISLAPLPELDCSYPPPPAPPPSLTLQSILGLDINVECITRYQSKPKSMYTFLCAKNVRRDEYNWHFRNVHCDIHSCLNGWLEQRCPLASYGCTYSQRRICADCPEREVVYSSVTESFGLKVKQFSLDHRKELATFKKWKEKTPEIFTSCNFDSILQTDGNLKQHRSCRESLSPFEDNLCNLPFEILRFVCLFLDSFSLCNLALTCKSLRRVVSSLLEERGIVIQEWLCKRDNGKPHWYIGYKRWMFSDAFTPVTKWKFETATETMANHLTSCPFYKREEKLQPYALVGTEKESTPANVIKVLQKMYPDFNHLDYDKINDEYKMQNSEEENKDEGLGNDINSSLVLNVCVSNGNSICEKETCNTNSNQSCEKIAKTTA